VIPGARLQAVSEILDRIAGEDAPAERSLSAYLRARRYIGAKDRRALGDRVFAVLRARARLDWLWARATGATPDKAAAAAEAGKTPGRARVLAWLAAREGQGPAALDALFDGGRHTPAPLDPTERRAVTALAEGSVPLAPAPRWVRLEVPPWLLPAFDIAFGAESDAELGALTRPAPVDLAVNPLKAESRAAVRAELAAAGVAAVATPLSSRGLRLLDRRGVTGLAAFHEGRIELQDEGAQCAAVAVAAEPGLAVCDLCAGAGGKTLALAGSLGGQGRLVACDVDARRLDRARPRLARAGAGWVATQVLRGAKAGAGGEPDRWLAANAGGFDRVLVDAPCSGSGTWRRQPDLRWRLTPRALRGYAADQDVLLARAAPLVRPGGRLVYVTCSLLPLENAQRIAAFRAAVPGFRLEATGMGGLLTPACHGTDGFGITVLKREETG